MDSENTEINRTPALSSGNTRMRLPLTLPQGDASARLLTDKTDKQTSLKKDLSEVGSVKERA